MPIIILYTAAMQGNRPIFVQKTLTKSFTYHLKAHQTFSDWKRGSLIV